MPQHRETDKQTNRRRSWSGFYDRFNSFRLNWHDPREDSGALRDGPTWHTLRGSDGFVLCSVFCVCVVRQNECNSFVFSHAIDVDVRSLIGGGGEKSFCFPFSCLTFRGRDRIVCRRKQSEAKPTEWRKKNKVQVRGALIKQMERPAVGAPLLQSVCLSVSRSVWQSVGRWRQRHPKIPRGRSPF